MNARLLPLLSALALAACGGGGEGTSSGGIPGYGITVPGAPVAQPGPAPAPAAAAPVVVDCSVAMNGDSISFGYGLAITPEMRLKEWRPKWKVTNRAVNGQAITEQIGAFENTQLTERVQVLGWGTNDVNKGFDFDLPYRRAVEHVKGSGRVPVITGLYSVWEVSPKAAVIRQISIDTGAGYAAWEQVLAEPQSPTDGHPQQAWSDLLWGRVVAVVDEILPKECK